MKLTQILCKQHVLRHFKKHWKVQGQKVIHQSPALKILASKNIPIYNPTDIFEKEVPEPVEIIGLKPPEIKFDSNHPDYKQEICYTYKNYNVLLEGITQAKSLTKTVEIQTGLPENIVLKNTSKEIDNRVKNAIFNSHIYDSHQEKLPKIKDPERPAWNFPRIYGIVDKRVNKLLTSRLLQIIEMLSGPKLTRDRFILDDLEFRFPFKKEGKMLQFITKGDQVLTSVKGLKPITLLQCEDIELPNLFPVEDIATLNLDHFYEFGNIYPIKKVTNKHHLHTIIAHYNHTEVKNLYEEPVTEEQILGHTLMKCFTAAASYAKEQFGEDIKKLPKPVTLQIVHTDGRLFHFGILQLNTLDLESRNGIKNIWYQTDRIPLFTECKYVLGKPILTEYNSDVIRYLRAFYENV